MSAPNFYRNLLLFLCIFGAGFLFAYGLFSQEPHQVSELEISVLERAADTSAVLPYMQGINQLSPADQEAFLEWLELMPDVNFD